MTWWWARLRCRFGKHRWMYRSESLWMERECQICDRLEARLDAVSAWKRIR